VSDAVLDALDQRILDSGALAPGFVVTEYLLQFTRPKLFASLCERGAFQDGDLAQLFGVGYGDADIERRLRDWLYQMYERDANPWRVVVVKALMQRGGRESLYLLEDIRFGLYPKLKTDRIVAQSLTQLADIDGEHFLPEMTTAALQEFVNLLDSAINALKARVTDANVASGPLATAESVEPVMFPAQSAGVMHEREQRVAQHLATAEELLSTHPDQALNLAGKAIEAVCKDLLDETQQAGQPGQPSRKPSKAYRELDEMIKEAKRRGLIPEHMEPCMTSIQRFRNLGSHDQDIEPGDVSEALARPVLEHARSVHHWYRQYDPCAAGAQSANDVESE
jgi:hypothetical protein